MLFPALLLLVASADPAWKIEITTAGGFHGHGSGNLTVTASGEINLQPGCRLGLSADDLKMLSELVGKARPKEWKQSYVQPTNPSGCCDQIHFTFTLTQSGARWTSTWFSEHLPLPKDLDALMNAVWDNPNTSLRSRYKAQCRR